MKDMWLKVLIGAIITLMLAGFSTLEGRKVDKSVFDLHKEQKKTDQVRIESQMTRIEGKIDELGK